MITFKDFLTEARNIVDVRHSPSNVKFFGSSKDGQYISPNEGFHFIYKSGNLILSSTNNEVYSASIKYGELPNRGYGVQINYPNDEMKKIISSSWNSFGGMVDLRTKTITISKVSVNNRMVQRVSFDLKNERDALLNLRRYGVTNDFKLKGLATPFKTVGELISQESAVEKWAQSKPMTFYHGTSKSRGEQILRNGLRPGQTGDSYVDLVPGYSEYNVYLATNPKSSEFYGKRQAQKDGDTEYYILQINNIDTDRLVSDDSLAQWWNPDTNERVIRSNRVKPSLGAGAGGQVGYRGVILPSKIKLLRRGKK